MIHNDDHPTVRLPSTGMGTIHGKPINQDLFDGSELPPLIVLGEGERLDLSGDAGQAYFYAEPEGNAVYWKGVSIGPEGYAQGPIALRGPTKVLYDRDSNENLFGCFVMLPTFLLVMTTILVPALLVHLFPNGGTFLGLAAFAGMLMWAAATLSIAKQLDRIVQIIAYQPTRIARFAYRLSTPIQVLFPRGFAPATDTAPTQSTQTHLTGFFRSLPNHTPQQIHLLPQGATLSLPEDSVLRAARSRSNTVDWVEVLSTQATTITGPLVYEGWDTNRAGAFLVQHHKSHREVVGMASVFVLIFVLMISVMISALGMPKGDEMGFATTPLFWITALSGCAIVAAIAGRKLMQWENPAYIKANATPEHMMFTVPPHAPA